MNLLREFQKHKYIKEIKFTKDKNVKISYYHQDNYQPQYLVNDNHIFFNNGYRTVLISDTKNETINPLDLKSAYPAEKFQTAIETKVIKDVFLNLKTNKLDIIKLLLFANIGIGVIILYFLTMGAK